MDSVLQCWWKLEMLLCVGLTHEDTTSKSLDIIRRINEINT
jgi:hypothetical protein